MIPANAHEMTNRMSETFILLMYLNSLYLAAISSVHHSNNIAISDDPV